MKYRVAIRHDEPDIARGVKVNIVETFGAPGFNGSVRETYVLVQGQEKCFDLGDGDIIKLEECDLPEVAAEVVAVSATDDSNTSAGQTVVDTAVDGAGASVEDQQGSGLLDKLKSVAGLN